MNKNLFLGMFVAASMLFTTSCSNDELEVAQSGNEAQVTFSLGLEDGIGSRAISDGTGATKLIYAVYKLNAEGKAELQNVVGSGENSQFIKTGFKPSGDNVTITLAKGQTYQVAFWAQNPNSSAYDTKDLTKVGVNYTNASNNNESRDAFFKTVEFTVTGSTSIDVELKRPFAQINVGVTKEDWEAAVRSGIEIEKSSVIIKKAANEINLLNGNVNGEVEVSYALQTIPTEDLEVDIDKDGEDEIYEWLSMSYILPYDETSGNEKTTLENISFVFAPKSGNNIEFSEGLNAVPVQRNWRTNILGKLLTGDITFNIVVDPIYEDDYNVQLPYASINGVAYKTFADAMAAVQDGETIKLEGETTLNGVANSKLFTVNKNITIDLNGYGFVANMPDVTVNSSIFEVVSGGELTIIGEGNVKFVTKAAPDKLVAFINNIGGTVNLKGGNWTLSETGEYALIPTFVDNNSNTSSVTLNIYDGTYTFHRNLFRNFANAAGHNGYATVATMNIYGGTFNGRESDEGAIWNQKPNSDANVPATAGVINVMGGTFNNVVINDEFAGVVYVENQEKLENALNNVNTHTIYLGAGKYVASLYPGDIPTRKSLTIIGSEGTQFAYTGSNYAGQFGLAGFDNITIRNCEILKRENVKDWGMIVFGSSNNPNGVYTFENCTFNGVGTQGIYINENVSGATYNILNCTFNGDFGTEGAITIQTNKDVNHIVNVKGCTFNNIPDTSHGIFLAPNGSFYYGWTLNTDLDLAKDLAVYYLNNALQNGTTGELNLVENVDYGTITVEELNNVTITGAEGAEMRLVTTVDSKIENVTLKDVDFKFTTGAGQAAGAFVVINKDAEIKNLVIEECTIIGDGNKNSYGIYGQNPNASIVVKKCNFSNLGYAIQATAEGGYESLSVETCTFENIISWVIMPQYGSYSGDLTITDCIFKNSKGGLIKSGTFKADKTFTFTNNIITDCTGHDGSDAKWFSVDASAATKVISGNKKDNSDWTPSTAEGLK